jgi:hypothetical protein
MLGSNQRPLPCKGRGLRSKAVGPTAKVRRREEEPTTVGVSSRLGGLDGSTDGDRIPPQHTSTRHNPFLGGVSRRIPPYHTSAIGLRIRRPQVRVLPSAPLKPPQMAGVYLCRLVGVGGVTTYLTTYLLLKRLRRRFRGRPARAPEMTLEAAHRLFLDVREDVGVDVSRLPFSARAHSPARG